MSTDKLLNAAPHCAHVCTCWDALAPLPLETSDHLLLRALLFLQLQLLLQLHHPLHQNLHLHRAINHLEQIAQGCLRADSRLLTTKTNNVTHLLPFLDRWNKSAKK